MDRELQNEIFALVGRSRDAIVCSIDGEGYPNAKAMFRIKNEGLRTFWFSTNTSALRTSHWRERPNACIYFVDGGGFHGLMLTGDMRLYEDDETKRAFWKEGDEMYYPLGPTDPDYTILRFTAQRGNYYHGLKKHLFHVDETDAND